MGNAKTALVTGASRGIGYELAKLFAADGHDLVLVARSEETLREHAASFDEEHDVTAHVRSADLSDLDASKALHDDLEADGITVDFLVNNAGFGSNGTFWELDREREISQVNLNVTALTHLTHLFVPGMVERGFGRVLNIASTAAFQPGPYMSTYYATKAYVLSFTEGLAHELKGTGVTATVHCPGATETGFAERAGNDDTLLFRIGADPADRVARHAYRSMNRGKVVAIPGLTNKLGAFLVRFGPRWLVRWLTARLNR